jgi:exportin-2 (importin alpha re-exporter)
MKSYGLFEEIICTINNIAEIMTQDAIEILNLLIKPNILSEKEDQILIYLEILNSIICLFHQINYQDFPEFFEDNLNTWMNVVKAVIELNLPQEIFQKFKNIFKAFLQLKTKTMRSLNLYCYNYYEDFKEYHDSFIQPVWNMVIITKNNEIFYKLNKELLEYYKVLFNNDRINSQYFNITEISQHIIQNLIIPNLKLTDKEMDDFEDNPVNYLKVELEEVDMESSKFNIIYIFKRYFCIS